MNKEYVSFYEEITMKAVADTVAKLLKYPFGFHGDTSIRDYLYSRLHFHGGDKLDVDDPRSGYSTLLLQSEHYTLVKYKNTGVTGQGARFDIALTLPPKTSDILEDRFAEKLDALFAFELGKNKAFEKVIDPDMLQHSIDTIPGTSDISKLYLELMHHRLMQGWVIEFYDSRSTRGASIISRTLDICKNLNLKEGKKLIVIFVGFSSDGKNHVSSNDPEVQMALIKKLDDIGINTGSDISLYANKSVSYQGRGWSAYDIPSASVEQVFGNRAAFANRIIKIGSMEECGRASKYVNLSFANKKNIAQIHPQENGIALVLRSIKQDRPKTIFAEIPVTSLTGCKQRNALWLQGIGNFQGKGPSISFLIPDEVDELDDNSKEWQDIVKLLDHAKTLT